MKYFHKAKASINKASHETARLMSAHLRSEARASGWPEHVVSNLHVKHDSGSFTIHAHPDQRQQVMDLEYGTTTTRPTAAIRRFNNDQRRADKFLIHRMAEHMKARS